MNLTLPLRMLAAVAPAMGNKDVRYYLNGVNFEHVRDGVIAVATNGHALIAARETLPGIEPFASFIMPREIVLELLKAGRKIENFTVSEGSVGCGGSTHAFAPIDGKYPYWRRVCPTDSQRMTVAPFDPDVLQVPLLSAQALVKRKVARCVSVVVETRTDAPAPFTLSGLPDGFSVAGVVNPRTVGKIPLPSASDGLAEILRP